MDLIECPACSRRVPLATINRHLDAECASFAGDPAASSSAAATPVLGPSPAPVRSVGDWLSLSQQQQQQQPQPEAQPAPAPTAPAAPPVTTTSPPVVSKGKGRATSSASASPLTGPRQVSLHAYFGGVDPTIPDHFILTRTAAGALEATFSRHGIQTLPRVAWTAAVHLRGLRKSVILATDIPLDELSDELAMLDLKPAVVPGTDGEEDEDDYDDEEDEDDEDVASEEALVEDQELLDDLAAAAAASSSSATAAAAPAPAPMDVDGAPPAAAPTPIAEPPITNVPFLKSHLQKCIRRRLVDQTVATATALIRVDYTEFIRRIPIIPLEDARVFSHAQPVLVWLMLAASKGYSPPPRDVVPDILGAVAQITASDVQDLEWCLRSDTTTGAAAPCTDADVRAVLESIEIVPSLPRWTRDLLWSVRCRREFGGMRGDMRMLDQALVSLFHRFAACPDRALLERQFRAPIPHLPAAALPPPIARSQFLLNAVDFHVAPVIPLLRARFPQFDEPTLKKTVWECSSGVNRRWAARAWDPVRAAKGEDHGWVWAAPREYTPSPELVAVWAVVEPEFLRIAEAILRQRG
ncbi:hypothetical protein H9P43_005372 [Blastocladiella emersonii ATCC 22665]|nr:hypothetical protein H9P43_005372 [Blastocladiella emersonii ATCC 22665]